MVLGQPKCFHTIMESIDWFVLLISWLDFTLSILVYYFIYPYFNYLTLCSTSRYSKLASLIFYSIYLIGYFIPTPLTSFFQVRYITTFHLRLTPPFCGGHFWPHFHRKLFLFLVNPRDMVFKTYMFVIYSVIWFWDCHNVFILTRLSDDICWWPSQKGYVIFKLCFLIGV